MGKRRSAKKDTQPGDGWQHPTGNRPAAVAVVALGPSQSDFFKRLTQHQTGLAFDEVWTVNTGLRYVPHDVVFVMDDLQDFGGRFPTYGADLAQHDKPIITSAVYPDYPAARAYPLVDVLNTVDHDMWSCYYGNSMPYVLAYAALIGVQSLALFGVDYSYPDIDHRETGREVCAVWCGYLRGRGVDVKVAPSSTLFNTDRLSDDPLYRPFYGYVRQPAIPGVTR